MIGRLSVAIIVLLIQSSLLLANEDRRYAPSKVVYDISNASPELLGHMFDRASLLQNVYQNDVFEASIIFVIHEGAVPLFVKGLKKSGPELMARAKDLTQGEIIQFRLCKASAIMQGYKLDDIESFVTIVPMADAEIAKLQQEGYAYLR